MSDSPAGTSSAELRSHLPGALPAVRVGPLGRAWARLGRAVTAGLLMPVPKRLLALMTLGLTLTLSVATAAVLALTQVGDMNARLNEISLAQRYHLDADMMHDALRSDVARAQQLGSPSTGLSPAERREAVREVRSDTSVHARTFAGDLIRRRSLQLPPELDAALDRLEPEQFAYIGMAGEMVEDGLAGEADERLLQDFERRFDRLYVTQAAVTASLTRAATDTRTLAEKEKEQALRNVAWASAVAILGWLVLVLWHHRSMGSLNGALLREAQQRSLADLLQRSLLPEKLPDRPGITLAARALPSQRGHCVGGDWYDVIPLPDGKLGLVVGDVLGHDLSAAAAMGQLRNALRAYALDDPSPAGVLARVNRAVDLLDVVDLATCLYAVLDPATLSVRWASAGHLAPLASAADGTGRLLPADPGPPFGVLAKAEYVDHHLQLGPGEALALYTDGLVERRGRSIDSGLDELAAVTGPYGDADGMCDRLMSAVLAHDGHGDDVTLLVARMDAADDEAGQGQGQNRDQDRGRVA